MDILKAKVKYTAGKVFEGQYGQSINCALILSDGKDVRVFSKPDDEKLKSLKKDDEVTLIYDGKSYKVAYDVKTANEIEPKQDLPAPMPPTPSVFSKSGKLTEDEVSQKAVFFTEIYAQIFEQLTACNIAPEQAQPAAATIFIQLGKHL